MKYKDLAEYINFYLYDNHKELIDLGICCEYRSIGYQDYFYFLDIVIWDSDNDEREYNEEIDEYESLEEYVVNKINKLFSIFGKINIKL